MSYIECNNLTLGYDGVAITRGISFHVDPGDYLCIVGENGAGKTTLMKTLLHLLEPISGELTYGAGLHPYEIGYLPQQTEIQRDFPASVWEIVLSGNLARCGSRPFYGKREKQRTEVSLRRMGIWDLRKKCYRNLSGGQQQRVLLARALCATTKLLLLDEPVSGLDPKVTADFYSQIKALNESGVTIIMISHDIDAALAYASHVLQIGKAHQFFAPVAEYRASHAWTQLGETGGEEHHE